MYGERPARVKENGQGTCGQKVSFLGDGTQIFMTSSAVIPIFILPI